MPLNTLSHQNKTQAFDFMRGVAVLLVLFTHLDKYQLLKVWPISYHRSQGVIGSHLLPVWVLSFGLLLICLKNQLRQLLVQWRIYAQK